jgi:hypothetical protein
MAGLNNIREAYEQVYSEALSADEKALRRELAADKRASKMAPSVASKYASSEAQSAKRADTKSKGKHIHGTVDEEHECETPRTRKPSQRKKMQHLKDLLDKKETPKEEFEIEEGTMDIKHWEIPQKERDAARARALAKSKAAREKKKTNNEEFVSERALDTAETGEKERLVKGLKKSAADFKKRYGSRWKNVMYATATARAKEHMDTSKSDRRYSVER